VRGVLDFSDLHFPKSYLKWERKNKHKYEIKFNKAFSEVMKNCKSAKRAGQKGSWINQEILINYQKMHEQQRAESIEVWSGDKLVGGLYGVNSNKYFSCESMFHLEDNVSKLAFVETVRYLKSKGQHWMDIQMVTSVCESFGGKLISKDEFLKRIGC
jgi:leucyl/phenylalanyl-tRNA--protein transferase